MRKVIDFLKRMFSIRVVIAGVEATDDECAVRCHNTDCTMHTPDAFTCNCKNILIDRKGKCATFVPKDGKHGEFPL